MKGINPKILLVVGVVVIAAVAAYFGGLFSAVDYGILKGDIRCSSDNTKYVFKIDFYTPDAGEHHVQAFCDGAPQYQVMRLAVVNMPAGDINSVTVERDVAEWAALMPCDRINFQLFNANRGLVYWRIDDDSVPSCVVAPTPTPTPSPTPTPTPTPTPSPARIDDSTDTLTFDKSSYKLGDTVAMSATGKNGGGTTWNGKVTFTITQPDGSVYTVEEASGINVAAGSSTTVGESFLLPPAGQSGTWTAQSRWITGAGVIDARSSILGLGEDDSAISRLPIIGGIAVFLLLLYFAFRKRLPGGGA